MNHNIPHYTQKEDFTHDPIMRENQTTITTTTTTKTTTTTTTIETIIISALSTLPPSQLSQLTQSISTHFHHNHRRRLSALLSSPSLFNQTLHHLHSLSLPHKTLIISRYLLLSLHRLSLFFLTTPTTPPPPPPPSLYTLRLHDNNAVLLLLLLCQLHQHNPKALIETPRENWREVLETFFLDAVLSVSGIGVENCAVLIEYVEVVARCMRFIRATFSGEEEKVAVAASPAAVVALPSVEVRGAVVGMECVICREEMREGRDVCELPCQHLFHWMCILPWLKKTNTCPCCRFRLPSDDILGEIQRLWDVLVEVSGWEL